jgi:hypothetical protein
VEEHLIEWNVEQLSHAGATPLDYTELGRELGHTRNTPMAEATILCMIPFPTMLLRPL